MSSSKDALMASLMMGGGIGSGEDDGADRHAAAGGSMFGDDDDLADVRINGGGSAGSDAPASAPHQHIHPNTNPSSLASTDVRLVHYSSEQEIIPAAADHVTDAWNQQQPQHQQQPKPPPPLSNPSLLANSILLSMSAADVANGSAGAGGLFDELDQAEQREREQQQQAAAAAAAQLKARQEQEDRQWKVQMEQQAQHANAGNMHLLQDQMQSIHLGNTLPPVDASLSSSPPPFADPTANAAGPAAGPTVSAAWGVPPVAGAGLPPASTPAGAAASSTYLHQPQEKQQLQQPDMQQGFYRDHPPAAATAVAATSPPMHVSVPVLVGSTPPSPPASHALQQPSSRYYQPVVPGNMLAGMHNGGISSGTSPTAVLHPPQQPQQPIPSMTSPQPQQLQLVPNIYRSVFVSEPLLIQSPSMFGIGQTPYWSYQINTELQPPPTTSNINNNNNYSSSNTPPIWMVRRRFRHVVALEQRLRDECPGAILPPRPDKHATRALEEASALQSAEFALQRANELQVYLNQLITHPICYSSHVLRLFLALQDDMGTAWPEVSANALTRLAQASVGAAVKVSESTAASTKLATTGGMDDSAEDNASLLALQSSESVRMGAVLQAVPKLEGAVTLMREHAELAGVVGMELSRLGKEVEMTDAELAQPMDLLAAGMLRSSRRGKRWSVEWQAAMQTFLHHHRTCRYERMAFQDRKAALQRRAKERGKADQRAAALYLQQRHWQQQASYHHQHHQHQQQPNSYGPPPQGYYPQQGLPPPPPQQQQQQQQGFFGIGTSTASLSNHQHQPNPYAMDRMERDAVVSDTIATDAIRECDEIGYRLTVEIQRIATARRTEWYAACKVMAASAKEAAAERVAIWTSTLEQFQQFFPQYTIHVVSSQPVTNVTSSRTSTSSSSNPVATVLPQV